MTYIANMLKFIPNFYTAIFLSLRLVISLILAKALEFTEGSTSVPRQISVPRALHITVFTNYFVLN